PLSGFESPCNLSGQVYVGRGANCLGGDSALIFPLKVARIAIAVPRSFDPLCDFINRFQAHLSILLSSGIVASGPAVQRWFVAGPFPATRAVYLYVVLRVKSERRQLSVPGDVPAVVDIAVPEVQQRSAHTTDAGPDIPVSAPAPMGE